MWGYWAGAKPLGAGSIWEYWTEPMQDLGYGLLRIHLPGTWVNKTSCEDLGDIRMLKGC
jgi:hypothetical protein